MIDDQHISVTTFTFTPRATPNHVIFTLLIFVQKSKQTEKLLSESIMLSKYTLTTH